MITSGGDPELQAAVEVLYHGARRDYFLGAHRVAMFLAIVFGASAATAFGYEKLCGLLAAVAAAADMAFDFVGRAQAHAEMRRRYLDLVASIASGETDDKAFAAEWMKMSADEPPLYRMVAEIAHRNACIALGRALPYDMIEPMRWRKRLIAPFWRG